MLAASTNLSSAQVARSAVAHKNRRRRIRPNFIEIDPTAGGLNAADPRWRLPVQERWFLRLQGSPRSIPSSRCKRYARGGKPPAQIRLFWQEQRSLARKQRSGSASNMRPRSAKRGSANNKVGGARRDRTDDLLLAKQALSQLSYGPVGAAP